MEGGYGDLWRLGSGYGDLRMDVGSLESLL